MIFRSFSLNKTFPFLGQVILLDHGLTLIRVQRLRRVQRVRRLNPFHIGITACFWLLIINTLGAIDSIVVKLTTFPRIIGPAGDINILMNPRFISVITYNKIILRTFVSRILKQAKSRIDFVFSEFIHKRIQMQSSTNLSSLDDFQEIGPDFLVLFWLL